MDLFKESSWNLYSVNSSLLSQIAEKLQGDTIECGKIRDSYL